MMYIRITGFVDNVHRPEFEITRNVVAFDLR
jgi:hypothetical protein